MHGLAILAAATLVVGLAAAAHADALKCKRTVAPLSVCLACNQCVPL
ncbi:MAG: hypothetical protein HY271_14525 [Deltaproteobacteria bacterium]|nr:hypothetical protein [Deltaproteobacteria bacterium]